MKLELLNQEGKINERREEFHKLKVMDYFKIEMKRIILLMCMMTCFLSFSDIVSGKRIQVRGIAKKEIMPNSAKVQLTIQTEDKNLDKASKENAQKLEKFKSLLSKSGARYDKINSTSYSTDKSYDWDTEVINKGEKEFKTVLSVEADNISLNSLKDFLSVLANEKIYEVKRNAQGVNIFEIEMRDKSAKAAYQKALDKFNGLQQKLGSKGLGGKIKIVGFTNDEVSLEKRESVKKEINTVTHTIEVETRDMKNIGNIISVAQILGIGTNGYIEYDIDNKQKLEDELYENAYKEALKKAQVILGKTDLNLKNPVTITDKSQGVIRPYSDYNYNYYGNVLTDSKILEKSEKELLDKVSEKRIVVNPRKLDISKMVYIEFEMN